MTKTELKLTTQVSSIFNDPKWICSMELSGFSSKKQKQNKVLFDKINKLVEKYNKSD